MYKIKFLERVDVKFDTPDFRYHTVTVSDSQFAKLAKHFRSFVKKVESIEIIGEGAKLSKAEVIELFYPGTDLNDQDKKAKADLLGKSAKAPAKEEVTEDDAPKNDLTAKRELGRDLKIKGWHNLGEEKLNEKIAEAQEGI